MKYHIFKESTTYPVALLMKASAFNKYELERHYVEPLNARGVWTSNVIAFNLEYDGKKVSDKFAKAYLAQLLPELKSLDVQHILCTDATYFKLLTRQKTAEPHLGYVLPCRIEGFEHMNVVLGINYQQLLYDPTVQAKMNQGLDALATHVAGIYQAPGTGIIHKAVYPSTVNDIKWVLTQLMEYPELTCDIEAFSLKFWEAGIGTISFAIDEHNGVAFPCDYQENVVPIPLAEKRQEFGRFVPNPEVRDLLRWFFENYKGRVIFHNAGFDVKIMIYVLWMQSLSDQRGLLEGLEVMSKLMDCTKIITYLATNSAGGNVLRLKALAQEFAGNWAVDEINDIRLIPSKELLQYNLVDALSTWYVKKKYYPVMVADKQLDLYQNLMLPTQDVLLQTELTGMPMNKAKIGEIKAKLEGMLDGYVKTIRGNPAIPVFEDFMTDREWEKDYQDRYAKAKNPEKIKYKDRLTYPRFEFNPGSGPQLQILLYQQLGLPVLDYTDTKQPATGADTLEKLQFHATSQEQKDLLAALVGYGQVTKILNTFIPAFEKAIAKADDGIVWLFGSFNIGGTVSGRLSSSDPNLTNIPAKSIFGKLIKEAFCAPEGWVFAGADFNSLEDYISALTTKDPNKLKVYAGSKRFEVTVNGITHQILEEDVVSFDGQKLNGAQLYEKLQGSPPRDVRYS